MPPMQGHHRPMRNYFDIDLPAKTVVVEEAEDVDYGFGSD